jgi:hypothetical protein
MRPILDPSILHDEMTPLEFFQNKTLRPLLKMQHGLIIQVFNHYLENRQLDLAGRSEDNKRVIITNTLSKDVALKNELIGMVIGHLTIEEMELYLLNKSESRRRITNMLVERILSEFATEASIL